MVNVNMKQSVAIMGFAHLWPLNKHQHISINYIGITRNKNAHIMSMIN